MYDIVLVMYRPRLNAGDVFGHHVPGNALMMLPLLDQNVIRDKLNEIIWKDSLQNGKSHLEYCECLMSVWSNLISLFAILTLKDIINSWSC
jgi:hypothetical protein